MILPAVAIARLLRRRPRWLPQRRPRSTTPTPGQSATSRSIIADFYFNVEIKVRNILQALLFCYFNAEIKFRNILRARRARSNVTRIESRRSEGSNGARIRRPAYDAHSVLGVT